MNEQQIHHSAQRLWLPSTSGGRYNPEIHVSLRRGKGVWVETIDNRTFMDANSGLWHLSLGYAPDAVITAAYEVLSDLGGSSLFRRSHYWAELLSDYLAARLPLADPKFFFTTSGSEACDAAIRIAFAFFHKTKQSTIGFVPGSYHGVSLGPLSLMGLDYRNGVPSAIDTATFPSYSDWNKNPDLALNHMRRLFTNDLAAVFVEVVQGSGGIISMPMEYGKHLRELADEYGVLLVADEVTTGVYRTGPFLASERHPGLRPDMIVLGKGLTAGIAPLSVVAVEGPVWQRVLDQQETCRLPGTTFSGNPLGCAAAMAAIKHLEESTVAQEREVTSAHLADAIPSLNSLNVVWGTVGFGHMWGIKFVPPDSKQNEAAFVADRLTRAGLKAGLLLHPLANGVLPVFPSLNITADEVNELISRLKIAFNDLQLMSSK